MSERESSNVDSDIETQTKTNKKDLFDYSTEEHKIINLDSIGNIKKKIPVRISYEIIDLFSGQLYSSPNKAMEELVCNSYDAMAQNCYVLMNIDKEPEKKFIAVWDDGESMSPDDFKDLWNIARRKIRKEGSRKQIGKFGIGKLATYIIGYRITFLCKKEKRYHAVLMDYTWLQKAEDGMTKTDAEKSIELDVKELLEDEVKDLITPIMEFQKDNRNKFNPFNSDSSQTWTLVIVDSLKEKSKDLLRIGRLKWILSTALPIIPDFNIFLNGEQIESKKEQIECLQEWKIGDNDETATKLELDAGINNDFSYVMIQDEFGNKFPISGTFKIYRDTLTGGKSEELISRSNGFFILVRNRLINLDDERFGLPEYSYQTFHRFRAEINADHLDTFLIANRESISENEWVRNLKDYLHHKFHEVRKYFEDFIEEEEKKGSLKGKVEKMPASLFSLPLKYATERILSIPEQSGFTIILPEGELPKEDGIIENIVNEELDVDDPIAIYDVSKGLIKLNTQHPVIMNFSESIDSIPEGLQLMAIAEVVTEAYLYETGISVETAKETMRMRDRFLREMVSRHPVSATYIATKIRDSVSDSKEFEKSLHLAFLTLGFRVKQMGQSGKPEGVAIAPLGMRPKGDKSEDSSEKYQIIYDAKSTSKNKVAAKDLNLAQIDQFKKEYNANYAVVVAKDFEGGNDPTANAPSQAKDLGICLLKAEDFSKLVEISAVRMIPLQKLRTLFECTNPMECSQWLIEYLEKTEAKIDLRKALEILWKMQNEGKESVDIQAIKYYEGGSGGPLSKVIKNDLLESFKTLNRLLPELIEIYGEKVAINVEPNIIAERAKTEILKLSDPNNGRGLKEALGIED